MPSSSSKRTPRDRSEASRGRTPWGTISRETVVDAAVKAVTSGGFQDMSIRSLAAELGVAPMTIYRHVQDKDDLLDEVVDRLLARGWKPTVSRDDWRSWTTQAADKLRRFLVTSPAALHVYLRHPVVSPAAIVRMNAMMDVLRQGMGDEDKARRAYAAIHTYTLGFAALEAGRSAWSPIVTDVDGLAGELATYTSPRQFVDGLAYLLDGIIG
jgi:TetR/AcrR family transcriptional regulator, tetracycline repressor protein